MTDFLAQDSTENVSPMSIAHSALAHDNLGADNLGADIMGSIRLACCKPPCECQGKDPVRELFARQVALCLPASLLGMKLANTSPGAKN